MRKETTHFISQYHEAEENLAEQFIALLEEKYGEVHKQFHFSEGTRKYYFNFCQDVEEYIEKTGKNKEEYQSWMVGNSNIDTYTISILSPKAVQDSETQDMEKVAVHELVHMIFDDVTKVHEDDVEAWIAEGIAILYAKQTDLNYISELEYPKLADLIGFDNFVDNQGYDYAGIYVWFFIERYGFEKFVEVYRGECGWQKLIYDGFEEEAICEYSSLHFAHKIFLSHGVTDEPERLSGGWTNYVYGAGELVLRFTPNLESGRLHRETQLVKMLPAEATYPEIQDSGRTDGYDWMLCRRIPGTNLEDAWGKLFWEERADALEQLWTHAKFVHTVDIKEVEAYVNKTLWYITTIENAVAESERLFERKLLSKEQCDVINRYIQRFDAAMKKAEFVLVHGDLTPANAMWQNGKIVALMDFECATIAPKEADLMMLLNTAYERMDLQDAVHDYEAKQQFHNRMRGLVQKEAPNWDILQGYRIIKLVHHVVMNMDDEDFSSEQEELVCLLSLLDNGKGKLTLVM